MKQFVIAFLCVVSLAVGAVVAKTSSTVILPDSLHWTPGTGASAGQMTAVLYGNPNKPGPFIIRVKSPNGFKVSPHYHASVENVTVLQGTLLLGVGDTPDAAKTTAVPTGGFYSIPKGVHHFAMAKGETIVEISSMGPRETIQVKRK